MTSLSPPPHRTYLLRHARSGWALPGQKDFDRTLDDTGRDDAQRVALYAVEKGYRPDLLICSAAMRCRQTAEAISQAFEGQLDVRLDEDLYNGSVKTYVKTLAAQPGASSVMLVGHNPTMEEVLETLVGHRVSREVFPNGYPTAGLAVLDHKGPSAEKKKHAWRMTDALSR